MTRDTWGVSEIVAEDRKVNGISVARKEPRIKRGM